MKRKKLTQKEILKGVRKPMPPPKRIQPSDKQKKISKRAREDYLEQFGSGN